MNDRPHLYFFILLLLVIVACSSNVSAHGFEKGQKRISPFLGISFANLRNNDPTGSLNYETSFFSDQRIGMLGGTEFEYFLSDNFSISISGENVQKGINLNSSLTESSLHDEYDLKLKNDYIVFSMIIRKYILDNKFFVESGLYYGFLIHSEVKSRYSDETIGGGSVGASRNFKDSNKFFTSKSDFGLRLGMGKSFYLSQRWLGKVKVSCDYGLKSIDGTYDLLSGFNTNPSFGNGANTGSSQSTFVESTTYYEMNPNTKNVYLALSFGASYRL